MPQNIEANTAVGLPRGPRTIAHEIGHAVGLSHPGHEDQCRRPDDWNTAALEPEKAESWRDGTNTHSDARVVRSDGKTPLDDRDTAMAFVTHADALDRLRLDGCAGAARDVRP